MLMLTITLSGVLPAALVFAADGDFVWAKVPTNTVSGSSTDGYGITLDTSGNVYTTGFFGGTVDFDPGPGTFELTSAGGSDIFVCKLDTNGNFIWAKSMGGIFLDNGINIAVDTSGNVYTTGNFEDTADFDPGPGTYNLTSVGGKDIFISKLDTNGNFAWAKAFGSTSDDYGVGNFVDTSGNVYTTGRFDGTIDFNPGPGISNLISSGLADIFISKLDTSGNFVWAKALGGTLGDYGHDIFVDTSGNVYTTGNFTGTADFDPGPGTYNLASWGNYDIFISKLDSSGNFIWAKAMPGTARGTGTSTVVNTPGNVYTSGYFEGTVDFDPGPATYNLTSTGSFDIFISKLDNSGNFVWAKALGGTLGGFGKDISVDSSGNVYTSGDFAGTVDFDPGPGTFDLVSVGGYDVFVSKLDTSGNFVWAKAMGGTSGEQGRSIKVDTTGNAYTTGKFEGTVDFDPGPGAFDLASAWGGNMFVSKLAGTGTPPGSGAVSTFYWPLFLPAIFNNTQP